MDIEIIEEKKDNISNIDNEIIKKIKKLNIDTLTPVKALNLLNDFKVMLGEK